MDLPDSPEGWIHSDSMGFLYPGCQELDCRLADPVLYVSYENYMCWFSSVYTCAHLHVMVLIGIVAIRSRIFHAGCGVSHRAPSAIFMRVAVFPYGHRLLAVQVHTHAARQVVAVRRSGVSHRLSSSLIVSHRSLISGGSVAAQIIGCPLARGEARHMYVRCRGFTWASSEGWCLLILSDTSLPLSPSLPLSLSLSLSLLPLILSVSLFLSRPRSLSLSLSLSLSVSLCLCLSLSLRWVFTQGGKRKGGCQPPFLR